MQRLHYEEDRLNSPIKFFYDVHNIAKLKSVIDLLTGYLTKTKPGILSTEIVRDFLMHNFQINIVNIILSYYDDSNCLIPYSLLLEIGNLYHNIHGNENEKFNQYLKLYTEKNFIDENEINSNTGYNTLFNSKTGYGTILHDSCCNNERIEYTRLLLQNNCDFNLVTIEGDSPIHLATKHKNYDAMKILLQNGVDLSLENRENRTPLDVALNMNDQVSFNLLIKGGAKYDIKNELHKKLLDTEILIQHGKEILNFCKFCNKKNVVNRCSGCKSVYYCNTNCQKKDWKLSHKKNCKKLKLYMNNNNICSDNL